MDQDKRPVYPNGLLIMAANSLGSDQDFPQRSAAWLKTADLVIFEEDRPARRALKNAGIHRPYLKFNEHRQDDTLTEIRSALRKGQTILYMSDQGCPSLCDPGRQIAKIALETQAQLLSIPGPSSLTAAIACCPYDCSRFYFAGMLDRSPNIRQKQLADLAPLKCAIIVLDAPYRLKVILEDCAAQFSDRRRGYLAFDISGPDELYWEGDFPKLLNMSKKLEKKLNFVLIISPE